MEHLNGLSRRYDSAYRRLHPDAPSTALSTKYDCVYHYEEQRGAALCGPGVGPCGKSLRRSRAAGFDRHPEQTLNVARTIYSGLSDDVRLWLRTREFVPVFAQRTRLYRTLDREV